MSNLYNHNGGLALFQLEHNYPWMRKMTNQHTSHRLSFLLGLVVVCFGMTGCFWDDSEYKTYVQTDSILNYDYVSYCPYGVIRLDEKTETRYVNLDKGIQCYSDYMLAGDDIYVASSGKTCDLIRITDDGDMIYQCELLKLSDLSSAENSGDVLTVDTEVESYIEKVKFRYKNIVRMCLAYQNHQELWDSDNPSFELKFVWSDQKATQSLALDDYPGMVKGNVCPADYPVCYANGREFGCMAKQCDGSGNMPNVAQVRCVANGYNAGLWEILKCKEGYYLNRDTNECIKNSDKSCGDLYGRHWEDCTLIEHIKEASCTEDGICKVESCETAYHPNETGTKCEADSDKRCGSGAAVCDGSKNFVCVNGRCICKSGFTRCTDTCIDLKSDKDHCNACDIKCDYACVSGSCVCDSHSYMDFVTDGERRGLCLPSDDENCGEKGKVCTTDDLENPDHVKTVACNTSTNKCEADECDDGYHVYNGICERDNKDNCGEHDRVCDKSIVSNGVAFACENGMCKATKCMNGYHVGNTDEDSGLCVQNTVTICGGRHKQCQIGDIDGSQSVACKSGRCQATSCKKGYHLANGFCIEDTTQGCGSLGVICTKAAVYKSTQTSCVDGKCVATECEPNYHLYNGICEINSVENCRVHARICDIAESLERDCNDGICKALSCKTDVQNNISYHPYTPDIPDTSDIPDTPDIPDGICEKDTNQNCGKHGHCCLTQSEVEGSDCITSNRFVGSITVACALDHNCEATVCDTPYYHKYERICEKNDNVNCGAHGVSCTTSEINNSTVVDCGEGVCHPTACATGYHPYQTECEQNTIQNCGEHGKNCNSITNSTSATCNTTKGLCEVKSCSSGHVYNPTNDHGVCEANSNSNCGSHGTSCTKSNVSNSSSVSCSTGTCKASSCKSGYHVYIGSCESDSTTNCGSHGSSCTTSKVSHSTSVSCSSGSCKATACSSGYHVYTGSCESDSTTNCGSHGTSCTTSDVSNSTSVSCSTGSCKATACEDGYELSSGSCV